MALSMNAAIGCDTNQSNAKAKAIKIRAGFSPTSSGAFSEAQRLWGHRRAESTQRNRNIISALRRVMSRALRRWPNLWGVDTQLRLVSDGCGLDANIGFMGTLQLRWCLRGVRLLTTQSGSVKTRDKARKNRWKLYKYMFDHQSHALIYTDPVESATLHVDESTPHAIDAL